MTLLFLLATSLLLCASVMQSRTLTNPFFLLAAPYFFIVLINQMYAAPVWHFYYIRDDVLAFVLVALICFFVGASFFSYNSERVSVASLEDRYGLYNMRMMSWLLFTIGVMMAIRALLLLLQPGVDYDRLEDHMEALSSGPIAHLSLVAASIFPMVFSYGVNNKNKVALVGCLLVTFASFASLVKYHIIGMMISTCLFIAINDRSKAVKVLAGMCVGAVLLFVGNYLVIFLFRGNASGVDAAFYAKHLWHYVGGSLIYDNYIFGRGIRTTLTLGDKLATMLLPLPQMVVHRLLGVSIYRYVSQPHLAISTFGETSNVVDTFGYLYPSRGDAIEVVAFFVLVFSCGVIYAALYRRAARYNSKHISCVLPCFLTYFLTLAFFSVFPVLNNVWEQLIYCVIMPRLFRKVNPLPFASASATQPSEKEETPGKLALKQALSMAGSAIGPKR